MQLVLFVHLISWRWECIKEICILLFDWNLITTGKRSWFIFQHGQGFIKRQLIYLIDIFQDNYNIVRDRFETDSVNVMKNRSLVAKKQVNFNIHQLGSVNQKTMKIVTRNNNTEIVRKPSWFVTNSWETWWLGKVLG